MAVPPPFPSDKPALRTRLRSVRRTVDPRHGAAIVERLRPLREGMGAIAGYVACGGEPDITPLLRDARAHGRTVALPRLADGRMTFVAWTADVPLTPGPLAIPQPPAGAAMVPTTLLMPLVGFDRRGTRLGQGGGYYDRWCAAHPDVRRIGIAWSVQEMDVLPVDPWDEPLHAVVTEREWIEM